MHANLLRESCNFVVDFNVHGKSKPASVTLIAAVWTLSRSVPRERQVGETAKFLWPEDGKYYPVEITDKHDDGTYDVYLLEDDVVVDNVDPKDFEPFKGTGDFEPFKGTYLSYYFAHSPSPVTLSTTL